MRRSHHIELRILLTCLYIYLNCSTFLYVKQVAFHSSLLSSPFKYPYTYIHIRAIVGGPVSFIYRLLLIYALWRKMADLLLISIFFLTVLIGLRLMFDIYGYVYGYTRQSLYYPFESFDRKSMGEEITDLVFALIRNCVGLVLSIYMVNHIINDKKAAKPMKELSNRRQSSLSE